MLISIIVLNWNGLKELRPCLAAIAENTLIDDYEVIVLDNDSKEPGVEDAVGPYPKVRLIKEPVNHGFSRGNNLAARQARGENLVFLNNDTLPRRDWLRPLVETQRTLPAVGIVGARLVDAADNTLYVGTYFQPAINAYADAGRNYPAKSVDEPLECEVFIGCGILIKRELFDAVGGFDEHYFQGYEDYDLCLKVRERGLKVMYCPGSVVEHIENVSMKKLSRRRRRSSKERNREFFERRWLHRLHEFRLPRLPSAMGDFSYYTLPPERLFEQIPAQAGRVLEVGCGAGVLGERLKVSGKATHVTGVELSTHAVALAQSRLDVVQIGDIESMPLDAWNGQFDTLIVADVLEHLRDPWAALFRLRDCLKDGGTVVASIPNIAHYKIIKKLLFADWRYEPGGILDHMHLRFFTRGSMEDLFRNAGFEILRIEREGRERWWSRLFGPLSERIRDFTAVQYYITARKRAASRRRPG
ncbi:MAG TPA: bifunctional glycosyltransferase family 2 protein/class I SAM-dependent methyltransferase [Burkholderiales bacterium]|nr:bifunctional glycosyltransferase family 2 protein/class I SAM-dependent methyltransferase [Burkholderiales bacterium]